MSGPSNPTGKALATENITDIALHAALKSSVHAGILIPFNTAFASAIPLPLATGLTNATGRNDNIANNKLHPKYLPYTLLVMSEFTPSGPKYCLYDAAKCSDDQATKYPTEAVTNPTPNIDERNKNLHFFSCSIAPPPLLFVVVVLFCMDNLRAFQNAESYNS